MSKAKITIESKTTFSLLVPDVSEGLVVPYNGDNELMSIVREEVMAYFDNKKRCKVDDADKGNGVYKLTASEREVDLD